MVTSNTADGGLTSGTYLGYYFRTTREPAYSLFFLLPLVIAYELLALILNVHHPVEVRNGADVILREALAFLNIDGLPLAMVISLIVILGALTAHRKGTEPLQGHLFAAMFTESCIWAVLIGAISRKLVRVFFVSAPLGSQGIATKVMLFLGAGVYEELVFRVLLIAFFVFFFRRILCMDEVGAGCMAVVWAALLFSLFHHLGPFGEPFRMAPFLFRFFAGLVLSALYVVRGLGIAAWSHALYDVFLYVGLA